MTGAGGFSRPRGPKTARQHHQTGPRRNSARGRPMPESAAKSLKNPPRRREHFVSEVAHPLAGPWENLSRSRGNILFLRKFPGSTDNYIFCYANSAEILTKIAINVEFHH